MSEYKVGQKLKCIKAVNTPYYTLNNLYTVNKVKGDTVLLSDDKGVDELHPWSISILESGTYDVQFSRVFEEVVNDQVNHPKHYQFFDTEAIEIIRQSLTDEEWLGYCKGNALKYRLRAGGKDEVNQEIGKARKYQELYEKYKDGVN